MRPADTQPTYWQDAANHLRQQVSPDIYDNWFKKLTPQEPTQHSLTLQTDDSFAAIWIQDNYIQLIQETIQRLTNRPMLVTVECISGNSATMLPKKRSFATHPPRFPASQQSLRKLNPAYTFANFVTGPGNQSAHLASQAAAQKPGSIANPICIHGGPGLGKTHLLHAHALEANRLHPHLNILYRTAGQFIEEFKNARQGRTYHRFRTQYRAADILLLDDIQFLALDQEALEEFHRIANDLQNYGKQILLACNRPPSQLPESNPGIPDKLKAGLAPGIARPDYETRLQILRAKAELLQFDIRPEVAEFLATSFQANIRRLEGALNCLGHLQQLKRNQPVDLPLAQQILGDILHEEEEEKNSLNPGEIQNLVAKSFHLKVSDLTGPRRPSKIAVPRQIAMYLCRNFTNLSLKEIGQIFGGRDHGTVIHACNTVENRMELEPTFLEAVGTLQEKLSPTTPILSEF
jgi:chromosomal replication initiator protein